MPHHPTRLVAAAWIVGCAFSAVSFAQDVEVRRRELGADKVQVLEQGGLRTLPADVTAVSLRRGEFAVARDGQVATPRVTATEIRYQLPIRMIGADATGERVRLRPVVEVGGGGLRYRSPTDGFSARVLLGLEDEDEPARSRPLGRTVRLLVTAEADSTTPESISIDHSNLPFATVEIVALRPGDSVRLRVQPDFDPDGVELSIPVVRPELTLRVSPQRIQGFGLETADLTIRVEGAATAGSLAVTLSSDRSRPEPPVVELDPSGAATALIRSNGVGTARVVAEGEPLKAADAAIEFAFPWAFAIAALAGGLVGGLIRFLKLKFKDKAKIELVPLIWHVLLGVLIGFVTTAAFSVGINLLSIHP